MSGYANPYGITIPIGNTPVTLMLAFYAKHPDDTQTFQINAARYLAVVGRSIVGTPTVTVNSSDVTIANIVTAQNVTTFQASGGDDGLAYMITYSAKLDDGSTLTRVVQMPVLSLYGNTTTPTIIAQGPPGPSGLLAAEPASDGYPDGGFWLLRNGTVVMAPIADLEYPTDANLCMTLAGSFGAF